MFYFLLYCYFVFVFFSFYIFDTCTFSSGKKVSTISPSDFILLLFGSCPTEKEIPKDADKTHKMCILFLKYIRIMEKQILISGI